MKQLLFLFIILCFSSCLGDDSGDWEYVDGSDIYDSVIETNDLAFDPVNIAVRFSLLMQEAGSFEDIETATVEIDEEDEVVREVLFGSKTYCSIEKISTEESTITYAITYKENYYLKYDQQRFGTFFIKTNTDHLFDDDAYWTVTTGQGSGENDYRPYIMQAALNAYYGDNSKVIITGSNDGSLYVEGNCYAYDMSSAVNSRVYANWAIKWMTIDFGENYTITDSSLSVLFSYKCSGQLMSYYNGYTVEQTATDLDYRSECSRMVFVGGKVETYNSYYIDGTDYTKTTFTLEREYSKNCAYTTTATYAGYTYSW